MKTTLPLLFIGFALIIYNIAYLMEFKNKAEIREKLEPIIEQHLEFVKNDSSKISIMKDADYVLFYKSLY